MIRKGAASMSDPIAIPPLAVAGADLALETHAMLPGGVTLALEDPASRWSLRARTAGTLAGVIGRAVPERIGETLDGLACLGPDEWLAELPAGTTLPDGAGQAVSVVDISARGVVIRVEGANAARVLASGCPLDLERFAVGRATRTVFETVEVIVWRERADLFRVFVWRSFAPWLWHALQAVQL
jgi:sarcosine oxidase subunit gamma